jgi:siroheme synthase
MLEKQSLSDNQYLCTVAKSVTFSTGHFKDSEENEVDVNALVNGGTLAIYMGTAALADVTPGTISNAILKLFSVSTSS